MPSRVDFAALYWKLMSVEQARTVIPFARHFLTASTLPIWIPVALPVFFAEATTFSIALTSSVRIHLVRNPK